MPTELSDVVMGATPATPPSIEDIDLSLFPGTIEFPNASFFERGKYRFIPMRAGEVDERLVRGIINSGFVPDVLVDSYFNDKTNALFLLEEQGRTVAVIIGHYLDVLATHGDHQQNGIGGAAMQVYLDIAGNKGGWRSKPGRPMNDSYGRIATPVLFSSAHGVDYNHYTKGLSPREEVAEHALMYHKPNNFQ